MEARARPAREAHFASVGLAATRIGAMRRARASAGPVAVGVGLGELDQGSLPGEQGRQQRQADGHQGPQERGEGVNHSGKTAQTVMPVVRTLPRSAGSQNA